MNTTHTTQTTNDSSSKPTSRQLRYLRNLAEQCGESFTMPRTIQQASREIARLKGRPRTPYREVRRERRQISDDMATRSGDAAQVREDEVTGYGSSARWSTDHREQTLAPPASTPATTTGATNPPKELGRYTTNQHGERIICGQRIRGIVRLTDVPATSCGRRIVIERGLTCMAELEAIVADYLDQAAKLDAIPALASTLTDGTA